MKRNILIVLILAYLVISCNKKEKVKPNLVQNESAIKIDKLNKHIEIALKDKKFVLAAQLSEQQFKLAEEYMYNEGLLAAYYNMGNIAFDQGLYEVALENFLNALMLMPPAYSGASKLYNNIGTIYYMENFYDKALSYYQKALENSQQSPLQDKAKYYRNIGLAYHRITNYNNAFQNYTASEAIYEQLGNKAKKIVLLRDLSVLTKDMQDYDNALNYSFEVLALSLAADNKQDIARDYNNIGIIYKILGNYSEAFNYFNQALALKEIITDLSLIQVIYENISQIALLKQEYFQALVYLQEAERIIEKSNDKQGLAAIYGYLAQTYIGVNAPEKAMLYSQKQNILQDELLNVAKLDIQQTLARITEAETKSMQKMARHRQITPLTSPYNYQIYGFVIMLLISLIFVLFYWKQYNQKKMLMAYNQKIEGSLKILKDNYMTAAESFKQAEIDCKAIEREYGRKVRELETVKNNLKQIH